MIFGLFDADGNDPLTTDAPSVTEGDAGTKALTFTLTLNEAPTMAVVVNYQTLTSGTASAGNDFEVGAGTVTFAPGQRTATVTVNVLGDTAFEGDETVQVQFTGARLKASVTATGTITNDDTDPTTVPRTFVLTTGVNTGTAFTGGAGDDTFDGSLNSTGAQTLQSSDALNGGAGTDTLTATIANNGTVAPTLTAIENVSATFTATQGTLSLANATGLQSLTNDSSNQAAAFSNIGSTSVALAIKNSSANTTFGFTSAATAGTNSVSLSLDNVNATVADPDITIAGVETVSIITSGGSSDIDLIATAATTITASGSEALTLDSINADGSTAVTRIDGSAMTAALTVTADGLGTAQTTVTVIGGSGNDVIDVDDVANVVSVIGGAGNDTITAANLAADITTADVINGGDGIDTLQISAALTVGNATGITSIETVQVDGAGNVTQDMDAFSATTVTRVNMAGTGAIVFGDVGANVTTLGISAAAASGSSLARKTDTTTDSLTVNLGATSAGVTVGDLTIDNEESITINSAGGANQIVDLHASDATSLTITGSQSLDLDNNDVDGATQLATINSSALTGAALGINSSQSTVNLTFTGGLAAESITSGAGNDTLSGDAGNDSLSGGAGNDSLTGGTGNDTLVGGADNDVLVGGDGNDRLEAGAGIDNLSGGAGNDTLVFAATQLANSTTAGTADTVDGGEGTDTVAITTATDFTSAVVLTSIETIELTTDGTGTLATFNAGGAASLQTFTIKDNDSADDASFAVTNLVTGVTVRLEEADGADASSDPELTALTLDTAAGASLTINAAADGNAAVTVTDAASVTVRTTGTGATNDIASLALDDTDTTSLAVTGGTTTNATLSTGDVSGTNALASVSVSSSTSGATVTVGTIADADALTSLAVAANTGNVTMGNIGASGSAEGLATVTVSASNGATATLGTTTADTTDSATDNAMTITASAAASSTVALGTITNTFGTITANVSGAGTTGAAALTADDVTLSIAAGGGTYTAVTATDDIVISAANTAALTFSSLDAGATTAGTISVTASGSAALVISDVVTSAGALTIDGASATGAVRLLSADDYTGVVTFTSGSGADSVISGSGNDVISTGGGIDSIDAGTGNDSINAGAGNDTVTFDTDGDLTAADTVDGGDGTDTLNVTTAQSISSTSTISNFEVISITANAGVETINLRNNTAPTIAIGNGTDTAFTLSNVASGSTVRNLDTGATALDLTIDTVDNASITVNAFVDATAADIDVFVADAASVTVTTTQTAAGTYDFDQLDLDNIDTTSLTVTGGTTASAVLAFGATEGITNSDQVSTYSVSTSTSGATVTVGAMGDADSLTNLTINAAIASATIGSVGGAGSAELLSQINVTATGGATATINGTVTADTTNSTTDLAMTLTASAESTSTVALGTIDNQFGTITGTLSGAGVVGATALTADDITLTWSAGGDSTITTLTADDDFTLSNSGAGAHTITTLTVGGDVSITHTGSGRLTLGTVSNGFDSLTVDASTATGALVVNTNSNASGAIVTSLTGGEGDDVLTGAAGNDTLSGGIGNDTITGGRASDSIAVGSGTDVVILNATVGTASDSERVATTGNDNDTGQDTISGFTWGTDTLRIVATEVSDFEVSADVFIGTSTGGVNDGTVGSFTTSTALFDFGGTGVIGTGDLAVTFASPSATMTNAVLRAAVVLDVTGTANGDTISGGVGNDTINGAGGADTIIGGEGADVITGGAGVDVITGSSGADVFVQTYTDIDTTAGAVTDVITDFATGSDTIKVGTTGSGTTYAEAVATVADLATLLTAADTALNGTVKIYVGQVTGSHAYAVLDDDGTGYTSVIQLTGVTLATIGAADFVL